LVPTYGEKKNTLVSTLKIGENVDATDFSGTVHCQKSENILNFHSRDDLKLHTDQKARPETDLHKTGNEKL
jgi:hypothetical protein